MNTNLHKFISNVLNEKPADAKKNIEAAIQEKYIAKKEQILNGEK